jgi:hypothetical protein
MPPVWIGLTVAFASAVVTNTANEIVIRACQLSP